MDGDFWVLNGQKTWTSNAADADWMFCLVRTEPDAPKHQGISYLLIYMKTPGIAIQPMRQMTGETARNAVVVGTRRGPGAQVVRDQGLTPWRLGEPPRRGGHVLRIDEKPRRPKTPYDVTGVYCYDARVFDVVRTLRPSGRGELEITDVNNWYIRRRQLAFTILDGWWTDAGTFESLYRAGQYVASMRAEGLSVQKGEGGGARVGRGARRSPGAPATARRRPPRGRKGR